MERVLEYDLGEKLYRGKRLEKSVFDDSEWVYGSLIDSGNHSQVAIYPWVRGASTMGVRQLVNLRMTFVDPDTVGQYTGKDDKNGKPIFEGDIVRPYLESGNYQGFSWGNMPVVFDDGAFCVKDYRGATMPLRSFDPIVTIEVVGNIHDNPELLKEGHNNDPR